METTYYRPQGSNTFRPRQNGCHFTDNVFNSIQIAPNYVQKGPEMKMHLETHTGKWRPQCLNTFRPRQSGCRFTDDVFKLISFYKAKLLHLVAQCALKHGDHLSQTQWIYCSRHKMTFYKQQFQIQFLAWQLLYLYYSNFNSSCKSHFRTYFLDWELLQFIFNCYELHTDFVLHASSNYEVFLNTS